MTDPVAPDMHSGAATLGGARSRRRERRLLFALVLNAVIVVAQIGFGIVSGSLGLLADAGHNLTDVAAVLLSLLAVRMARRPPTRERSFGWHRGTILAAQANAASILAVTVLITYEGIRRLLHPQHVQGGVVLLVALVAFVANAAGAAAVHEHAGPGDGGADLNMRSALVHLVGDAVASLGVAAAGAVMLITGGWSRLDPAVSLGIGALIAWQAWKLLRASSDVLLEATPEGLDLDELRDSIASVGGVDTVHDLHVWSLSSEVRAMSAHVVVSGHPSLEEAQAVGANVKSVIAARFRIAHATLELECETCEDDGPGCDMESIGLVDASRGRGH